MATPKLTMEQGLAAQREHLDMWREKLIFVCFAQIRYLVNEDNKKLTPGVSCGRDVMSNCEIDELILNWKPNTKL